MSIVSLLQTNPVFFYSLVLFLGLCVGSFLNVVIYRLPIMLKRGWKAECYEYLELAGDNTPEAPFNLVKPDSTCPSCGHKIRAWENIPVLSYLFLRGRCSACSTSISLRYPLIETITAIMSLVIAWQFGASEQCLLALILSWSLIALTVIDIDEQLLPDNITLPLLWLGLIANSFSLFTDLQSAVIGAVAGYLSLWLVYHAFRLITGKEGMGFGDFKLFAVFGAWMGWQSLPMIILLASLVGATIGIALIVTGKQERQTPIPFGPFLAMAGWIMLVRGNEIQQLFNTLYL